MGGKHMGRRKITAVAALLLACLLAVSLIGCGFAQNAPGPAGTNSAANLASPEYIAFDDIKPSYVRLSQSWDAMGMDDKERVYIGWTCKRDNGLEDFAVFRYDRATGERKFLGTLMDASEKAGNLHDGEQIPKGHTRMIFANGKIYIGSQGFHDFKEGIEDLPSYRGAHLYAYDIQADKLEDISAAMPDGVVVKNQGIVALNYMPEHNLLVGLTHPHSDIVLIGLDSNKVEKVVKGIPWKLGNPLSREILVTKYGKIYTYRGTEDARFRDQEFNMWEYDIKTDKMGMTENKFKGGFWNGRAETGDGSLIYISTCNGELYVLHTETGKTEYLTHFLTEEEVKAGNLNTNFYSITLSNDEKKLYAIPSTRNGNLYQYDTESKKVTRLMSLGDGIYCGGNIKDSRGNLYFARFDVWEGNCRLLVIPTE
jgi:hypothetical protein